MIFEFLRKKKQPSGPPVPSRAPGLGFCACVVSDVGCVRENNEDNYVLGGCMNPDAGDRSEASVSLSDPIGWQLAGVFDGMGGGEVGELASRAAAESILAAQLRIKPAPAGETVDLALRQAFQEANNKVVDLQREYQVFGTTGTVLCTDGTQAKLYHLGDSRAYLYRGGKLNQLTRDQTLAQMKLEMGMYHPGDPAAEKDKHKLTEYIGRDGTRKNCRAVESCWMGLMPGDRFLLCSDGLYDMCTDGEITELLSAQQPLEETAAALTEKARQQGGVDNVTCMLVAFE